MTTDHREQAERYLASADTSMAAALEKTLPIEDQQHAAVLAGICTNRALTHATLARDEEHAASTADMRDALRLLRRRERAMRNVVSRHIAHGLTSANPSRWRAARSLAQGLDEADVNIDNAIEEYLAEHGHDSEKAWAGTSAPDPVDDPWAASPDITADVPKPVRRVIAGQIASMLLSSDGEAVQGWARNIATALKNEGADLDDAIKTRIYELTLGHTDMPF